MVVQAVLTALMILILSGDSGDGSARYTDMSIVGILNWIGEGGGWVVAVGILCGDCTGNQILSSKELELCDGGSLKLKY